MFATPKRITVIGVLFAVVSLSLGALLSVRNVAGAGGDFAQAEAQRTTGSQTVPIAVETMMKC
jgi:hypothetical protein